MWAPSVTNDFHLLPVSAIAALMSRFAKPGDRLRQAQKGRVRHRGAMKILVSLLALVLVPAPALADEGPAFEVNLLWPFFPGGLVDLKAVFPTPGDGRAIAGVYSDFAWRFVRDDGTYGQVAAMGIKPGYRQFFGYGLHAEATLQLNWRHERDRPDHPEPLNGFQGRLWTFAGYQHELSPRAYINARAGIGVHLFRTDELGDEEKMLVPAGDLNLGIRF